MKSFDKAIHVLQVVSGLNYGGIELFLKNMLENMPFDDIEMSILVTSPERGALEDFFEQRCHVYHLRDDSTRSARKKGRIDFFRTHKNEFDVVHIHTVFTTCYSIAKIAKKYQKCKVIIHSHIAADYSFKDKIKNNLARPMMNKYADIRLACSRNSAVFLFGKKFGQEATVINNAIDRDKYAFSEKTKTEVQQELGIAEDMFVIGNVGRMSPQKNQTFLVDIFYEYHKSHPKSKLLIVGDGALRTEIEKEIARHNLSGSVILTGAREDVYRLLNAMDCFVLPSLFEGLAISAVEAQANGMKCYLSDTITDDIDLDNRCTFCALSDGAAVWASSIENSDNRRRDNRNDIIEKGYDIVRSVQQLYSVYAERSEWKER